MPTGPREGDQYGFDPAAEVRATIRDLFDQPERDGNLTQIGQAAGLPTLSPIKRRLLEASVDIRADEPEELAFQHTCLTQCSMPAAKPKPGVLTWERRQGRTMLQVSAGTVMNPKGGKWVQLGLPYGPKARLLLMHLNSEAIRSGSPVIPVEDSMTAFFRRLMGRAIDGRQVRMLKTQLSALAAATFRMGIAYEDHSMQMTGQVVGAFELWSLTDEGQRVLWPATLRLSTDYFESLSRYAVPLDERAIAALAFSAVALDIYCWLAQRLHRIPVGKQQFVPWTALLEQFGQGYREIRFFRRDFLHLLQQVKSAYPEAIFQADGKGMYLTNSPPPVRKKLVMLPGVKTLDLKAVKS
jgi:hypothetical protein